MLQNWIRRRKIRRKKMEDKYKMFKNFMYNELEISKNDIKEWVRETVKETVNNYIQNQYSQEFIEKTVKEAILNSYRKDHLANGLMEEAAKILIEMFEINIQKK
jgi:hypothetical protein